MNNSTVNFTSEASTNSTYDSVGATSLVICTFSINFIFGVPTHSYILWLIITGTGSGVASDFFNLNLSVCEIGICLNSLFCVMYYCTGLSFFISLGWFSLGLLITGRPLFQCLICVERYLAVIHPVIFLKFKPLRYRVICCTVAWIIIIGSCLCFMFASQLKFIFIYTCTRFISSSSSPSSCFVLWLFSELWSSQDQERGERERRKTTWRQGHFISF